LDSEEVQRVDRDIKESRNEAKSICVDSRAYMHGHAELLKS